MNLLKFEDHALVHQQEIHRYLVDQQRRRMAHTIDRPNLFTALLRRLTHRKLQPKPCPCPCP